MDMGAVGNPRDPQAAAVSVSAVLAQMQTELRELVTQRKDLVRRIKNLHQVTRGLREIARPLPFHPLPLRSFAAQKNGSPQPAAKEA